MSGYIYVMESGDGYCKIGRTIHPETRKGNIESSTGLLITNEFYIKVNGCDEQAEKAAHDHFRLNNVFLEWFNVDFNDTCSELSQLLGCKFKKKQPSISKVKKQRGVTFDDIEWDAIKQAASNTGYTTVTSYLREVVMKQVKKDVKK